MKPLYLNAERLYLTISDAYLGTLEDVFLNPDYRSAPRGLPIREKVNYIFTVANPTSDFIVTNDVERNKVIAEYTAKEIALYDSCSNRVEDFEKASKFWRNIANNDGTINSAYGYLIWKNRSCYEIFTPWEWAVLALKTDKDSRQAFVRFSLPSHQWAGNKDQVCTMHANFLIRNDKLHLTVVMRSNDLWLGLTYDLPWFCSLLDTMLVELQSTYPNLQKGTYTHLAHSAHIYERDIAKIERALGLATSQEANDERR